MGRCSEVLERQSVGEVTTLQDIQARSAVQQRIIEIAIIKIEPESAPIDRPDETRRSKTRSVLLDWKFLIIKAIQW